MVDIVERLRLLAKAMDNSEMYAIHAGTEWVNPEDEVSEAASEILRLRAEVERLTAKAAEWDRRDGIDGAACYAIREMLNSLGVPRAAFIDDHVANAYLHGKAEERERAAQIAEKQADEYASNARDLRYCYSDRRVYAACATRHRDIAAAIRQAASGEGET